MSDPIEELKSVDFLMEFERVRNAIAAYDAKCSELEKVKARIEGYELEADRMTKEYATSLDSERAANAGLREAFSQDQPWSLLETLSAAYDAIEHMMVQHDCDCHGWERFQQTKTAIGMLTPKIKQALSTDAGKPFLDRLREAEGKVEELRKWLLEFGDYGLPNSRDGWHEWLDRRTRLLDLTISVRHDQPTSETNVSAT